MLKSVEQIHGNSEYINKNEKKSLDIILLYSYTIRGQSYSDSFSLGILKLIICHHIKNSKSITFSSF